ncbi:MAG TPA: site-2 protease family protein [Planctomycetaceae bacterium]|jgi:Zn-dependent protease|nr:site-2 protease family protein [Planctomycetaceae bacterium]
MLGNSAPTPYDLRFSLLGIPVRVHPLFWLFSAVMGWDPKDPNRMLLWIACVFVSILVHEFGHALTANYFGWPPEVVLYSFGGYASFHPTWGHTRTRSVLILLAGPGAGFVLFGAIWCVTWLLLQQHVLPDDPRFLVWDPTVPARLRYVSFVLIQMAFINLWWGLVNLLPVFPLDGGQIARELLTGLRPRDGLEISLKLSLLVGGGVAVFFFMNHRTYAGILFAALAVESLQHLQGMRYR